MSIKEEAATRHWRKFHVGSSIIYGLPPVLSQLFRPSDMQQAREKYRRHTICGSGNLETKPISTHCTSCEDNIKRDLGGI